MTLHLEPYRSIDIPTTTQSQLQISKVSKQQCLWTFSVELGMQGAEGKVREGVSSLAEVRRRAGQQQEEANTALQAQQAATQAAQHQLKAAEVLTALPDPTVKVVIKTW